MTAPTGIVGSHRTTSTKVSAGVAPSLTPRETARILRVSTSWLAKRRMDGTGPPFIKLGRCIRYSEAALVHWMRSQQRLSTAER
jgi:hypothetical protein